MASLSERKIAAVEPAAAPSTAGPKWNWQLAEVLVFLFLIVPSMAFSFLVHQQPAQLGFVLVAVTIMLRDLSLAALVVYFLRRNGESLRQIGWRFDHVKRDILLGVLLFPVFFLVNMAVDWGFLRLGLSAPAQGSADFLKPQGVPQLALAAVLVMVVAVTEESIFRGYLLLRFSPLSRSTAAAVILSSLIFSIGHGYEGAAGVATVGVMGMIFALIYLWRGSLVAPVTMHFLQDFLVIVVLSLATPASAPARPPQSALPESGPLTSCRLREHPDVGRQTATAAIGNRAVRSCGASDHFARRQAAHGTPFAP